MMLTGSGFAWKDQKMKLSYTDKNSSFNLEINSTLWHVKKVSLFYLRWNSGNHSCQYFFLKKLYSCQIYSLTVRQSKFVFFNCKYSKFYSIILIWIPVITVKLTVLIWFNYNVKNSYAIFLKMKFWQPQLPVFYCKFHRFFFFTVYTVDGSYFCPWPKAANWRSLYFVVCSPW